MSAEEIAKDESKDWIDRIRAAAELEVLNRIERIPLCLVDRVYVAKFYEHDGPTKLAAGLMKKSKFINKVIADMKVTGEYDLYRNLTEQEFENMIIAQERRERNEMQSKRMPANSHNIMGDCISM